MTGSSFLPITPPLALISLMVINAVSFREVSEIAIVPESECKIPTLIVSPLAAGAAFVSVFVCSVFSAGFEQPTSPTPTIAAISTDIDNLFCILFLPTHGYCDFY